MSGSGEPPGPPSGGRENASGEPAAPAAGSFVPDSARSEGPGPAASIQTMIMVVYILYLVGLASGIAALVGVVLAYVNRDAAQGTWAESHIQYQIRTWWMGLLLILVGVVLAPIGIGILILMFFVVWAAVRSVKGLSAQARCEPIPDPAVMFW